MVPTSPLLVDPVVQQPLAPWWKRLVAIIIDAMLVSFSGTIILLVISAASGGTRTQAPSPTPSGGAAIAGVAVLWAAMTILGAIYYGALNGSARGQTVGKMALGIAVRDARRGGPIGFWRGFGRSVITWLFAIAFAIPYLLDSLAPLWDRRRQAWHDKVAHSVVVDLRP
jgi:uncharacterized RDD family membrane protein YckC